jgi:hypothetical protein
MSLPLRTCFKSTASRKLARQSAKREKISDVLKLRELQALLVELAVSECTFVLFDAATGLQVRELLDRELAEAGRMEQGCSDDGARMGTKRDHARTGTEA